MAVYHGPREKTVKHIERQSGIVGVLLAMSVEFVISPRSFYDSGLLVSNCSFHPHEPVLACAVQHGTVRLYQQDVAAAVGSIVPMSKWRETVLNPVSTQYPVSDASCLQWDANGERLAVGYDNGTLILWNGDGCRLLERRKHTARIGSVRWNPIQPNIFASASSDGSALVWDADKKPSPLVQRVADRHGHRIHDVVWISGTQFAFYSSDQNDGIIHICQIGREYPIMALVHGNSISSLRWNGQLNLLASVSSFTTKETEHSVLQIWSPDQTDPIKTVIRAQSEVRCIDWFTQASNQPLFVVGGCADGSTIVWNLSDVENSHKKLDDGHYVAINDLSFSPDRKWLASIDRDGNLIVRLAKDWRKVYETKTQPNDCRKALSWSGSSDKLAIVNARYEVFLVEIIH